MANSLKLIYKNMVWRRPIPALVIGIAFALLLLGDIFWQLWSVSHLAAWAMTGIGVIMWFVMLPCIFFIIDSRCDPERIRRMDD